MSNDDFDGLFDLVNYKLKFFSPLMNQTKERFIHFIKNHPIEFLRFVSSSDIASIKLMNSFYFFLHPKRCFLIELDSQIFKLILSYLLVHEIVYSLSNTCKMLRIKTNKYMNTDCMLLDMIFSAPKRYLNLVKIVHYPVTDKKYDGKVFPRLPGQ